MDRRTRRVLTHARPVDAFAVRGRAIRTFASFAVVLALGFVVLGIYLIADEFRNPLASQSIGLFAAAFVLATAMSLLIELAQLVRSASRHTVGQSSFSLSRVDLTATLRIRTTYQLRDPSR